VPRYRKDLANSHNSLGSLLRDLGQRSEAETAYRAALRIQEQLAADFPLVPQYRIGLGLSFCNYGILLSEAGKQEPALEWYAKAIVTLTPVLEKDPRVVVAREFLRNSHWGRAETLYRLQRPAEAVRDWDRAIELDTGSQRNSLRLQRALSLVRGAEPARAVAEANDLAAAKEASDAVLYDGARVCSLASAERTADANMKDQYALQAVAFLRQAQAKGYFKDPARVEHLKKDTDLEPLRSRADYQQLLAELEGKAVGGTP
jgi:tetratricopeptide (TPR) repeat protein